MIGIVPLRLATGIVRVWPDPLWPGEGTMNTPLVGLTIASGTFVGTHILLSHPLRAPLVARLGKKGFAGLYAAVALASMAWMAQAFRAVPPDAPPLWNGTAAGPWSLATVLMLIASILLVGSLRGNPALPDPRAGQIARAPVRGVFHITRHPMMWAFALWAASHAVVAATPRVLVLAAAIALLALGGAALQDRKKDRLMGADWQDWARRTRFWPRLAGIRHLGIVEQLGGVALWLVATWAHIPLAYVPAGPWRWIAA